MAVCCNTLQNSCYTVLFKIPKAKAVVNTSCEKIHRLNKNKWIYGPTQQWPTPLQAVRDVRNVVCGTQPTITCQLSTLVHMEEKCLLWDLDHLVHPHLPDHCKKVSPLVRPLDYRGSVLDLPITITILGNYRDTWLLEDTMRKRFNIKLIRPRIWIEQICCHQEGKQPKW